MRFSATSIFVAIICMICIAVRASDSASNNFYAIIMATRRHMRAEEAKRLLEAGDLNPGVLRNASLRHAAHDGNRELAAVLLGDRRVDPTVDGNLPLSV